MGYVSSQGKFPGHIVFYGLSVLLKIGCLDEGVYGTLWYQILNVAIF